MTENLKSTVSVPFSPASAKEGDSTDFAVEIDDTPLEQLDCFLDFSQVFDISQSEIDQLPVGVHIPAKLPDVIRYGRSGVKVYCPQGSTVELTSLTPIGDRGDSSEGLFLRLGLRSFRTFHPSGWNTYNRQIVFKGRKKEPVIETITFNGSSSQKVKLFYDNPDVAVIKASNFIDAQGNSVPAPTQTSPGVIESQEGKEVYGGLVVAYEAGYNFYHVYYDFSDINEARAMQIVYRYTTVISSSATWRILGSTYTTDSNAEGVSRQKVAKRVSEDLNFDGAPLYLVVKVGTNIDFITISRKLGTPDVALPVGFNAAVLEDEEFSEIDRSVETVRVENPDDPNQYVDVDRVKTLTIKNVSGRVMVLKMASVQE